MSHLALAFRAPDLLGDLFVDLAPMAHGEDADDSTLVVDGINDTKASYRVFSQSFQFAKEKPAGKRILAERSKGLFNAALQIRRQVTDNVCYVGWDIWPEYGHQRLRLLGA